MNPMIQPGAFLRNVLAIDALLSGAAVVAMTLGAGALSAATALPQAALVAAGIALIPWVALLLWVRSRPVVASAAVWTVIGLNVLGALICAVLAFGAGLGLTPAGTGFVVVNGAGALLLADLEFVGLRRSAAAGTRARA